MARELSEAQRVLAREYQGRYRLAHPDRIRARLSRKYADKEWHKKELERRRKAYRLANGDIQLKRSLSRYYGITLEQFRSLEAKQNGVCAICLNPQSKGVTKRLHVDHCHKTGEVRGLLCMDCNNGLGAFKDNSQLLSSATEYLKRVTPSPETA